MESQPHEIRDVTRYVELEAPDESVTHAEKVREERVLSKHYEVWDVHTDQNRYWVVTNLTNLYDQEQFTSADNVLTFHIGLMYRILDRSRSEAPSEDEEARFSKAWRRYGDAVSAFNAAEEAEDFQAVAAQCRQCLLAFVRELDAARLLADDEDVPKLADFKGWTAAISRMVAENRRLRSYLQQVGDKAWDLVAWLVHYEHATALDAEIALDATSHVLHTFGMAFHRYESKAPDRCPTCDSYRVVLDYRPEEDDPPYFVICEACGWEEKVQPWCEEGRAHAVKDGIEPVDSGPPDGRPGHWNE